MIAQGPAWNTCPACSKPIKPGSPVLYRHGELYHLRCVNGAAQLRAMEQVDRAKALTLAAQEIARSSQLILRGRTVLRCADCGRPFMKGAQGWVRSADGRPVHLKCPPSG